MKHTISIRLSILLLCIVRGSLLPGQAHIVCRSQPFVFNYTKSQYGGATQNWSVAQDRQGILYFGNTYGLLEYNGADWHLHTDPEIRIVRTTFADRDGRIYTGSHEEFGYWQRDAYGSLYYTSISQGIPDQSEIKNTTVWRIFRSGEYLFLHSFSRIFVWDGNEVVHIFNPGNTILPMFIYRDLPYFSVMDSGLYYIDERLELVKEQVPDTMNNLRIQYIFDLQNDSSIVFTEQNGIFLKHGQQITPGPGPDNEILKQAHINRVVQINNNMFAIGTIQSGIILTDRLGYIRSRLDRTNGLQHNTVLDLMKDRGNNLWIALQEGIDFTEIMSPYRFVKDKTGELGSVRCSRKFRDKLYIGTNFGLFYADWDKLTSEAETDFKRVPGLEGHVLSLEVIDNRLICGYNLGTYEVDMDRISQISRLGGWNFLINPLEPGIAYQGHYSGLSLFKKDAEGWWKFSRVMFEGNDSRFIQIDHEGNLWSSSAFKGLTRHRLNHAGDSILESAYLGKEDGFISDNNINVFKLGNRLVFANETQFFTYDYLNRTIVPYEWLNGEIGPYALSHIIMDEGDGYYWFLNRTSLGRFQYHPDSLNMDIEVTYDYLHSSAVEYIENISATEEGHFVIGLVDGFVILNDERSNEGRDDPASFDLQINSFHSLSDEGDIQPVKIIAGTAPRIPIRNRNLFVKFSVPGYTRGLLKYRYRISDQEPWTELGNSNELRYNNLKWGSYDLEIVAYEESSGRYTDKSFPFSIRPSWYFHWIALLCYLIILLSILLLTRRFIRNRMIHHQWEIQENLRHENERKMAELKEKYLQRELRNKSKELLNYTIMLDKRNELLQRLKSILSKEIQDHNRTPTVQQLKLLKTINDNINTGDDWEIFKVHFDAANSDFLERLKQQHETLTPSDMRFCGFLRMNLTSKEIASLLNISLRSIEVKRYRLRKKLSLEHNQNLVDYLMGI